MPAPFSHPHHNMISIPGGTFLMGSRDEDPNAEEDEKPQHLVTLSSFALGQHLITQHLWQRIMGKNPSSFEGKRRPLENVSWLDAIALCNKLSKLEGLALCYFSDPRYNNPFDHQSIQLGLSVYWDRNKKGYRLPTQSEWEIAARCEKSKGNELIYSGSDELEFVGWYNKNSGEETQEVGLMAPNASGFYDMSGNVLEWCWDWYDSHGYIFKSAKDPIGPHYGSFRVMRGGNWLWTARESRVAHINRVFRTTTSRFRGLRVARTF